MQYLMISNPGVSPVEAFTILGVSSKRDDESKIGKFGSGNKHGILVCLRMGLDPIIYLGKESLEFYTTTGQMGEQAFQRVNYRFQGQEIPTSLSLDFGALDWSHTHMALREFVSNAIDEVGYSKITLNLTTTTTPIPNCTTVYIPATPDVLLYFRNIGNYFLHFRKKESERILDKDGISPCRIYRKGVFVRELKTLSAFDYNFLDDVNIDESRNMDEFNCLYHAAAYSLEYGSPTRILKCVNDNPEILEAKPSEYLRLTASQKKAYVSAFRHLYGTNAVIGSDLSPDMSDFAVKKGYNVITMKAPQWYAMLMDCVPCATTIAQESQARESLVEPTPEMQDTFHLCWRWLGRVGLTMGKPCPQLMGFRSIMNGSSEANGMYKNGTVYINVNNPTMKQVYLEEMAHYITGANDGTRDFQDYAFNLAARSMDHAA